MRRFSSALAAIALLLAACGGTAEPPMAATEPIAGFDLVANGRLYQSDAWDAFVPADWSESVVQSSPFYVTRFTGPDGQILELAWSEGDANSDLEEYVETEPAVTDRVQTEAVASRGGSSYRQSAWEVGGTVAGEPVAQSVTIFSGEENGQQTGELFAIVLQVNGNVAPRADVEQLIEFTSTYDPENSA